MSRDLLDDAISALQDEGPLPGAARHATPRISHDATRMRVLGSVRAARRRRALAVRGAVLLLAAAIGSTAWAAATGRLPALGAWTGLWAPEHGAQSAPVPATPTSGGARAMSASDARAATPTDAPAATAGDARGTTAGDMPGTTAGDPLAAKDDSRGATEAREAREPARAQANSAAPSSSSLVTDSAARSANHAVSSARTASPGAASSAASAPVEQPKSTAEADTGHAAAGAAPAPSAADPADALYEKAHALHFQRHDFGAARAAWEAYLKAAPGGRFAVMAHYNRALCLVRLGRREEARRALLPFAKGSFGGYRREEAQSLIDALGGGGQ